VCSVQAVHAKTRKQLVQNTALSTSSVHNQPAALDLSPSAQYLWSGGVPRGKARQIGKQYTSVCKKHTPLPLIITKSHLIHPSTLLLDTALSPCAQDAQGW